MMLRGAAPAFDPVLVPAAALPSMSEKDDPTLQPGMTWVLESRCCLCRVGTAIARHYTGYATARAENRGERRLVRRLSQTPQRLGRKLSQGVASLKRRRSKPADDADEADEDADPPIKVQRWAYPAYVAALFVYTMCTTYRLAPWSCSSSTNPSGPTQLWGLFPVPVQAL